MKIYFIERIKLHDLTDLRSSPIKGDWVIFFREAQDFDGSARRNLRANGVTVWWGRDLLKSEVIQSMDNFVDHYLKNWFLNDGRDLSRDSEFSMGEYVSGRLTLYQKPALIVALGQICLSALDIIGNLKCGSEVWSDIRDGESGFPNQINRPGIIPRRQLVKCISESFGLTYNDLKVENPLPVQNHTAYQKQNSVLPLIFEHAHKIAEEHKAT